MLASINHVCNKICFCSYGTGTPLDSLIDLPRVMEVDVRNLVRHRPYVPSISMKSPSWAKAAGQVMLRSLWVLRDGSLL